MVRHWTGWERRWLLAIFSAIFPSRVHAQLTLGASDVALDDFVTELCRDMPALSLVGLRGAVWLIWLAPLLLLQHARVFGSLTGDEQTALLERMASSRIFIIREVVLLAKVIAAMGFCALPEVMAQTGQPATGLVAPAWARRA